MVNIKRQFQSFDIILVLLVLIIGIFGIIVLGSALGVNSPQVDPEVVKVYYKQIAWFVSGFVLLLAASFINYQFICKFYIPIYLVNIALLIIVLFMPKIAHVTRWIVIGPIRIQPSEFAKIFMIICLSKFIDIKKNKINNISSLMIIFAATALPVLLIIRQPSLSVALVLIFIMIVALYAGNLSMLYFLAAIAFLIPVVIFSYYDLLKENSVIINFFQGYQVTERIVPFLTGDTSGGYLDQTNSSIEILASGQLSGKGLYNGLIGQYSNLVQNADNDFIFSIIGEEFGFIGCMGVLSVLILIILKCLLIANNSVDLLGRVLASGVAGMIGFHTVVNVGVVTGLLPNTGMPLPFISAGGSSMWANMVGIGLVINVRMSKQKSIFEE